MVLKRIASALLPPESRENILGDLEERGFRWRDVVSVLISSELSSFRREWFGPVPNLANASDARIELRIEQLLRTKRAAMSFIATGMVLRFISLPGTPRLR